MMVGSAYVVKYSQEIQFPDMFKIQFEPDGMKDGFAANIRLYPD